MFFMLVQLPSHLQKTSALIFLLMIIFCHSSFGQTKTISGKVTDSLTNESIPGVTIRNVTRGKIASTDQNGNFNLQVTQGDSLRAMFIGYKVKELIFGAQQELVIALASGQQGLNEVVVTALGIKKEKQAVGYSIQEVKGPDLVKAREPNAISN